MPNFVGDWFLCNDVKELASIYYTSILALLLPWRDLNELKSPHQTFKDTFDTFIIHANSQTLDIITHECSDSGSKK
jgi:hypothetical protein